MPLNQQDKDELAALGIIYVEAPPDSWVYRQGTVFLIDHPKPAKLAEHLVDQDDDEDGQADLSGS